MCFNSLNQDLQDNWDGQDIAVRLLELSSSYFISSILFILTILIRTHSSSESGFTGWMG